MRGSSRDDPSGKDKIAGSKAAMRFKPLLGVFALGLCIGLFMAERQYVHGVRDEQSDATAALHLASRFGSATKRMLSSGVAHVGAILPHTGTSRNELETLLRKVAPDHEVLVAVANRNVIWDGEMLDTFTKGLVAAGVKNHIILALDQETVDWCHKHDINVYLMNKTVSKVQAGTGDNHAVSAMKFGILRHFLELGYSVLLSDADMAILQNPFEHLYRDSDIEGMSDGYDEVTAYGRIEGFDDPSMGWARFAQAFKHFNLNSGLFYVRANERTLNMMLRLEARLAKEQYWDQTAYNEEIFFLSHDEYKSPQVSARVMNIYQFMNSKVLFKDVRHRSLVRRAALPKPVMIHINYHPDKSERLKAVFQYYAAGDASALDKYPDGSEPGSRRRLLAAHRRSALRLA